MDVYDEVDRRETDAGDVTRGLPSKLLLPAGGGQRPAWFLLAQLLLSSSHLRCHGSAGRHGSCTEGDWGSTLGRQHVQEYMSTHGL